MVSSAKVLLFLLESFNIYIFMHFLQIIFVLY